ncbi:MAG TPA: hypothetical protein VIC71_06775 [Gammaproteobacteria bacterium]|jgi:hypothetical protein
MHRVSAAFLALAIAAGCGHLAADEERPAVLVAPTDAVRAELRAALTAALGQAPVAIADDALTQTYVLIIDRAPVRELENRPLDGRVLESTAERFELVLTSGECVLRRPSDSWHMRLASATCRSMY